MSSPVLIVNAIGDLLSIDNSYSDLVIVNDNDRTSGNTFQWVSSGTANDGTIYEGSSGYWQIMYEGPVNVKWFGVVGSDTTNDSVPFQAALAFVISTGGTLFIPVGTYYVTNIIVNAPASPAPFPRFNIIGEGQDASQIVKYDDSTTNPIFSFSGVSAPPVDAEFQNELANFSVSGNSKGVTGFVLNNYARFTFRNVKVSLCDIGFDCHGVLAGSFLNCTATTNHT